MLKHRKLFKVILVIILILSLTLPVGTAALTDETAGEGRCTSFYMGKGTTENGSYIWGRSEDYSATFAKLLEVRPAADHELGAMYKSGYNNFEWPYPEHTFRYILCKDSDAACGPYKTDEVYAQVGINEKNVAVSASVTLSSIKSAITGLDPMVPSTGLEEADVASIVLMQAETARHGCEILAEVFSTAGAASRDGVMISDPNEVWYFQVLSGHQYVAVRCPDDMIGFSPNITGNVGYYLDGEEGEEGEKTEGGWFVDVTDPDVIASEDLISTAIEAGTFVGYSSEEDADDDEKTLIKVADSYASSTANYWTGRMRVGYGYLYGLKTNEAIQDLSEVQSKYLDYFIKPPEGKKYTLYDAMRLLASRGEGTEWEVSNPSSNSSSIGNDRTLEAHVFETRPGMPGALATMEWICMGPGEFSVYLPYYGSLVTDTFEKYYAPDTDAYNDEDPDSNNAYWVFRELYTQCKADTLAERERLGNGVRDFWERYQKSLIEQQALVDAYMVKIYESSPQLAEEKATELSMKLSEETYEYAKQILAELKEFKALGEEGPFVPAAYLDQNALPHYAPEAESTPRPRRSTPSNTTTTTITNADGSVTTTVTNLTNGTVTETTKYPDGSETVVETKKDGSSITTMKNRDGSSSITRADENGKVETTVTLPSQVVDEAMKQGDAVPLPMPRVSANRDRNSAPVITINGPSNISAKVEIPVRNVTGGVVAILIRSDGTEEIIKNSITTENGVLLTVKGNVTVKIVDNSKNFSDVARSNWAFEAVAFASSRELFSGTGAATFSPNADMTRSMLVTVLARLDGQDTTGGETWYSKAVDWAKATGVSDGSNLSNSITREQLASMLYRYARNAGIDTTYSGTKIQEFSDYGKISGYAAEAMAWCVNTGLISGMGDNTLNPQGNASRAQVASILMRFCENAVK